MAAALQIVGALLILVPFAGLQLGRLAADAALYLWLNFLGSLLLAGLAIHGRQWGFLLLEACWALVSARGLLRSGRRRTS